MKTQTKPSTSKVTVSSTLEKYTTLAELEKSSKGPVYVLNNLRGDSRGTIVVPVARRNGNGQDIVRIAGTFIPQDLTLQVSKTQLIESTEFRQTIGKKLIRLLNAEYAQTLLSTADAKVEAARVSENLTRAKVMVESQVLSSTSGGLASMIKGDDEGDDDQDQDQDATEEQTSEKLSRKVSKERDPGPERAKKATDTEKPVPSSRFRHMIDLALKEKHTPTEIVADLKNFQPLSRVDVKYALKFFNTYPRVATFLKREMEKAA